MTKKQPLKIILISLIALAGGGLIWYQATPRLFLVARVIDGDTIDLADGRTIRYLNIDTPELAKGQTPDQCFALKARQINEKLVEGKKVRLETDINEMGQYGRTLAYVYLDDLSVSQYLLEQGAGKFQLDTLNLRHSPALAAAAQTAQQEKAGLWSECASEPKAGCLIKGNLDRMDKRWYHLPSFRHYEQTTINLEHGDQWFCTEEEAIEAGFERARE